ncbi:lipopolysaccharide export system permease protein [Faunimonas pinastri]|uniref:Lipopolysaccharide export system permease protein n=1 Tax=Faunimonas pinastri TaxID=1855383 RepID=A0A1H9D063_9HYPH|nr:LPS export ABC transporter permease LptG [Faunimonas pinastri]SEQ06769.1 lipopolysaccharide export system permease protein [Faunimonas pinastri]
MLPGILNRYIARRFISYLLLVVISVYLIMFLVDFLELVRRLSDKPNFGAFEAILMSLMRTPQLLELLLPFIFLFSSMLCLFSLSRKLELVVARASGISAWGFLAAPFMIAIAVGLFSSLALNPIATTLKDRADAMEATMDNSTDSPDQGGVWFRQDGSAGPSIVYAKHFDADTLTLQGVVVFLLERSGAFRQKLVAPSATYADGAWTIHNATVSSASAAPTGVSSFTLPTNLSTTELQHTLSEPDVYSIWSLPDAIRTARRTGLNTDRVRLAFHLLLERPLYLLAMVGIAATVSLRLVRYGGTGRLILTGVGAGFLLYVATKIVNDLGGNGIINPALAAWSPAVIALVFGATALLHQEDG